MIGKYDFSYISIKWPEFEFRTEFFNSYMSFALLKKGSLIASIYPHIPREEQAEAMGALADGYVFWFREDDEWIQLGNSSILHDAGYETADKQIISLSRQVIDDLKQILKDRFGEPKREYTLIISSPNERYDNLTKEEVINYLKKQEG